MAAVLALQIRGPNLIVSFLLDWAGLGWIGRQNVIKSINLLMVFDLKSTNQLQWPFNWRVQFDCVVFFVFFLLDWLTGLGWIGLD